VFTLGPRGKATLVIAKYDFRGNEKALVGSHHLGYKVGLFDPEALKKKI
jgi:hypothetical protein